MPATRRQFISTAATGLATAPAVLGQARRRPDVVFILVDEWRSQATGYHGDPNVQAPVLDRFAAQSVSFENTISGTPVCCPQRASLLTGQYPLSHGVFINDVELKPNGVTMGEAFTAAGYKTGYIGKWHLYGSPDGKYGRRLAWIPPEKRFGFDYWKVCECTHDYNHSLYYDGNDQTPKYWPVYDAFAQTEDACSFIGAHAKSADPFCLVLALGPPHFPLNNAPEKFQAMYRNREIQFRPNVPPESRAKAAEDLRGYYAHMAAVDTCLERVLTTLDQTGIAEDTIVIFTSDHGDMMMSQGLTTKLYPWDESIRVPFLVRYPRKLGTRGRKLNTLVNSPDIFPTLMGLAGLPIPASVEGANLSAAMTSGPKPDDGKGTLLSLPVPITEARTHGFAEYRGLRTRRYTYVRSIHGPWLLYDNQTDPFQMHNLIGRAEAKQPQAKLDHALDAELKVRKDEFLPAGEYVRRFGLGQYNEVNIKVGHHSSPWGDWNSTLQP